MVKERSTPDFGSIMDVTAEKIDAFNHLHELERKLFFR